MDVALIQKARGTLTELGAAPPESVTVRKIPLPVATGWIMSMSRDGRFVAYLPKDSYDFAVCEVATGKTWTVAKGTKENFSWNPAQISPDGQLVAYRISGSTINIAKIDGSEKRKLYEGDEKGEEVWLDQWSPDGNHVIVAWDPSALPTSSVSSTAYSVVAWDTNTGAKREIARVSKGENPQIWNLSPGGQYLAVWKGSYPKRITLLNLKSGQEETVVDRDAGRVFGWLAGDTKLLYSKHRIGGIDLWAIGIKEGKPLGAPELVWSNLGEVQPLGISRDGSIYGSVRDSGVLWVMDGYLTRKMTVAKKSGTDTEIPPDEILAPNQSILDRKLGLSTTLPTGWTISSVVRRSSGANLIAFQIAPAVPGASPATLIYRSTTPWDVSWLSIYPLKELGPKPTTSTEIDSWLRNTAQATEEQRIQLKYTNYRNRPAGVVSRTVNGHPALSWSGDYTKTEKNWTEYFTLIYSDKAIAKFWLSAPAASIDTVRPALEQMIETVRLP